MGPKERDMGLTKYDNFYHRVVAMHEFGIYNWKQHSTGWLLKQLRSHTHGYPDWHWSNDYKPSYPWEDEYVMILREVLAERPHQSRKRQRNGGKNVNKSGAAQQRRRDRYNNMWG